MNYHFPIAAACVAALLASPRGAAADTSFTINNTTADAFLAAGSPNNPVGSNLTGLNFGALGSLAVSPASSAKGEFDTVMKFNTAGAVAQFNSTYGAGNWQITGFTLYLASNFGGQGEQPNNQIFNAVNAGSFGMDWLAYDSWVEGTGGATGSPGFPTTSAVSFNSISTLFSAGSASLGTFTYAPPGDNIYSHYSLPLDPSLAADAAGGGDVTFYLYAADNQVGYVFGSRTLSADHPELVISAAPVPEPSVILLFACTGVSVLMAFRRGRG